MDLLPKSSEEFSSQKYWDAFFSKRKEDPFEWYGEYPELATLLHKYISSKDNLLVVGCGNSSLSNDLYTAGIKSQKSLDISSVVVNQMKATYPHLDFVEGDVTAMNLEDQLFSCVLDKGTFDALSPPPDAVKKSRNKTEFDDDDNKGNDSVEEKVKVELMMDEVSRVVKPGGRFVCISLLQPHVASRLLSYFHNLGWMTRVVRCIQAEEKTAANKTTDSSVVFPVFMIVFTKIKLPVGMKPVLEAVSPMNGSTITRFSTLEELIGCINDQQNFALVKRGLLQLGFCAERGLEMHLANATTGDDRYILHLVDVPKLLNNPISQRFGVFIVPQGRESEWLFSTHEGRTSLAMNANFTRLVVVHLVRGQVYDDMNAIQEEIKGPMASLSPQCVTERNIKAPIMTLGNDLGDRVIIFKGRSEFSGDFVVEDVACDGEILRRLIFLNNSNIIQSEVEISVVKKRGKEFKNPVTSKLSCQHHGLMTLSFGFLKYFCNDKNDISKEESSSCPISALLIGLGGGLLASFLVNFMPNLKLSVVEIDSEIVQVAHNHFGLPPSEKNGNLNIVVDDGLKFIQSTESQYKIILIDVDNKSTKEGLSCPPPDFLEIQNLENYKKVMDPNGSVLVLNLVCRNEELKTHYINRVRQVFPFVISCDVTDEVNNLLYCFPFKPSNITSKNLTNFVKQSVDWLILRNDSAEVPQSGTNKRLSSNKKSTNTNQSKKSSDSDVFCGAFNDIDLLVKNFKAVKL